MPNFLQRTYNATLGRLFGRSGDVAETPDQGQEQPQPTRPSTVQREPVREEAPTQEQRSGRCGFGAFIRDPFGVGYRREQREQVERERIEQERAALTERRQALVQERQSIEQDQADIAERERLERGRQQRRQEFEAAQEADRLVHQQRQAEREAREQQE